MELYLLFDTMVPQPLAARLRPQILNEFVNQIQNKARQTQTTQKRYFTFLGFLRAVYQKTFRFHA